MSILYGPDERRERVKKSRNSHLGPCQDELSLTKDHGREREREKEREGERERERDFYPWTLSRLLSRKPQKHQRMHENKLKP